MPEGQSYLWFILLVTILCKINAQAAENSYYSNSGNYYNNNNNNNNQYPSTAATSNSSPTNNKGYFLASNSNLDGAKQRFHPLVASPWNYPTSWKEVSNGYYNTKPGSGYEDSKRSYSGSTSTWSYGPTYTSTYSYRPKSVRGVTKRPPSAVRYRGFEDETKMKSQVTKELEQSGTGLTQVLKKLPIASLIGVPIMATFALAGLETYMEFRKAKAMAYAHHPDSGESSEEVKKKKKKKKPPPKKNDLSSDKQQDKNKPHLSGTKEPLKLIGSISHDETKLALPSTRKKKSKEITKDLKIAKESVALVAESFNKASQDLEFLNVLWNIDQLSNPKNATTTIKPFATLLK